MKVRTDIAGSFLVVEFDHDHYIDVKSDARYPDVAYIEVVRQGFVRERYSETKGKALVRQLMVLIKQEKLFRNPRRHVVWRTL